MAGELNVNSSDPHHSPKAGFWTRRLTDVYTAAARGIVGFGSVWFKSSGKWSEEGISERRGENLPPAPVNDPIWIHAASMGEVRVAAQFAAELVNRNRNVIVSSMTESGFQLCSQVLPAGVTHFRIPFDLPKPIRRMLTHFHPAALVLVETEWWPNILLECSRADVPVFVINGRLSQRAYQRYRIGRAYWSSVLSAVRYFYMRSHDDADRVRSLGVDPTLVRAAGTLKALTEVSNTADAAGPREYRDRGEGPIWIAGCTRPGEEDHILAALSSLREEFPNLRLWVAPRHPNRFDEVAALIDESGYQLARWSELDPESTGELPPHALVLIDRMGILADLYRYADVAFVGGSLVPLGGHNPLEPALAGTPVTFGHYMEEQRDAADMLLGAGLAREVWGAESLALTIAEILRTPLEETIRRERAGELLDSLRRIRAEVADDLCLRIDSLAVRS
jgi:3-deoxy-D-manno-octulosonic-acid transferase